MKKIVLLEGGLSSEREVSLKSAAAVKKSLLELGFFVQSIDPKKFINDGDFLKEIKKINGDIVFNALHGEDGENGKIQSLLENAKIKFTGSSSLACALAMDKNQATSIANQIGIPTPQKLFFKTLEELKTHELFEFPIVIKPNSSGSSIGVFIIRNSQELLETLPKIDYSDILVEKYIPGRELTISILNGKALPIVEIKTLKEFYNFENKYSAGNTSYEVPAQISVSEKNLIQEYASKIYSALGCEIYGRVDFRFDGKNFYFLEVNTLPGMTALSLTPMAAKEAGITFNELTEMIIDLSLVRN